MDAAALLLALLASRLVFPHQLFTQRACRHAGLLPASDGPVSDRVPCQMCAGRLLKGTLEDETHRVIRLPSYLIRRG